jgi:hypothetical protein
MIDLGSFLASYKSKTFLAMRGTVAPLQTPQTEGDTSPFWQAPDISYGLGAAPKKSGQFLNNISQTKSVGGQNKALFHHLIQQNKGVKKALKGVYIA